MKRPSLFLDRDGVINVDHGHVHSIEKFDFAPGIFDLVRAANKANWFVVVVTNQAGIAKGFYSETQFAQLTEWMLSRFEMNGARIDRVYHCPHHPDFSVNGHVCDCRKPKPGMLFRARDELNIDLGNSIIVGDKCTDLDAGRAAGVRQCYLVDIADRDSFSGQLLRVEQFIRDYSKENTR